LGDGENVCESLARDIEDRDLKVLNHLARAGAFRGEKVEKAPPAEPDREFTGKVLDLGAYRVPVCGKFAEIVRIGR